ncbi:MAG: pentapeptide repeat-containing protein [Planctomycetota bacterium]
MSDSEKPKSWKELIKNCCVSIDRICKPIEQHLSQCAILNILGHAGRPIAFLSIIVLMFGYIIGAEDRRMQAENQRKEKQYQAWQVISVAQGKKGDLGRKIALQDLNSDGISLAGVDISHATLENLNLENADLSEAIISKAILIDANFSGAKLFRANLYDADLHKVNLSNANLMLATLDKAYLRFADLHNANLAHATLNETDLRYADLSGAILTEIKNWEQIIINNAYIHGVKDPPKGFEEWAYEHGAFSNANREEWKKLKQQKRQEQEKKEQQK